MHKSALLVAVASILVGGAGSAYAADRVRAGQWETTATMMGRTATSLGCLSGPDAAGLNGNVASIRTVEEKRNMGTCKVTNVTINANQVAITSVCAGAESVGTTTYHGGDAFETVNTNGLEARAKWLGASCK